MDLDKLKETWQNAEIKSSMSEAKIQRMLNIKGQHAYNKIQQYEKRGLGISIALVCFGVAITVKALVMLDVESAFLPIFITIVSIFLLIWNIYKKSFLKKIDVSRMSIIGVSKAVNRYKRYLVIENIVAFIGTSIFAIIFVTIYMFDLNLVEQIILALCITLCFYGISYIGYKFTIAKNMETINQAIKETKEFEKENIE